jgi:hypothetical protein
MIKIKNLVQLKTIRQFEVKTQKEPSYWKNCTNIQLHIGAIVEIYRTHMDCKTNLSKTIE